MKNRRPLAALVAAFLPIVAARGQTILPPPPAPAGNPTTPAKALLGKALFWDEQLSSSRSVACGTCHVLGHGGSDPRAVAALHPGPDGVLGDADDVHGSPGVVRHDAQGRFVASPSFGIRPQVTARKAPSPIDAAYGVELFWDGRARDAFADPVTGSVVLPSGAALESQIAGPPTSDVEMSHVGRTWTEIANDLGGLVPLALADQVPAPLQAFVQGQTYATLFQQVFGSPGVTPVRIIFAIASYERTLVADQSPFDLYLAGQGTLPASAARGLVKFGRLCNGCHTDLDPPVLATGPVLHDFRNVGVRPIADDPGRAQVTGSATDLGRFKVPGLRNVALRAPYFHNGGMPTLGDVIDFYSRGGDFHVNQDPLLAAIPGLISLPDRFDLLSLLQSLTDPRVASELPPFDRPRLWSEGARVPVVFGAGTPGAGGFAPRSVAVLPAYAGNAAFTLGVDEAAAGVPYLLVLDVAAQATPTTLLGQNVFLGLTASATFTAVPLPTQGAGAGGGYGSWTLPIPAGPGLAGATFFGQWLVADPQGPCGLTVSDAFALPVF